LAARLRPAAFRLARKEIYQQPGNTMTAQDLHIQNLFWTSGIVNKPEEFWGRDAELDGLPDDLQQSGIAISGPVGIGKSSLLSNMILMIEGFQDKIRGFACLAMCSENDQPWQIARKLFQNLRDDSEQKVNEIGINLRWFHFKETSKQRELNNDDYVKAVADFFAELSKEEKYDYLTIAFDECHQCPTSLAVLIRQLKEELEHSGVSEIRFLTSGIGTYLDKMISHNQGLERVFQRQIWLKPWGEQETVEFVTEKLKSIVELNRKNGGQLGVGDAHDDKLQQLFYKIGGGHPYLTQLLGSHMVRQEKSNPDGFLDVKDLVGAMDNICKNIRKRYYLSLEDQMEAVGMKDAYTSIIENLDERNPSRIRNSILMRCVSDDEKKWLLESGAIFLVFSGADPVYQLTDELLRVSMMLRDDENAASNEEKQLFEDEDSDEDLYEDSDEDLYEDSDEDLYEDSEEDLDEDSDEDSNKDSNKD
jgi:hypothetical protein